MSDNPAVEPDLNPGEPEQLPTEQPDVTQETLPPEQDVKSVEKPEDSDKEKPEESETDGEEVAQYLELDGEEYDLEDVRQWQKGHMMQKDYTKKTQAVAEERKKFEAERDSEREKLSTDRAKVDDLSVKLEALVIEDDAIDWTELKENDPEEYIRLKEKADKRKELIEQIKAERDTPADDPVVIVEEQRKLFAANPEWLKDGKTTDAYNKDIKLMNDHFIKQGYTAFEITNMTKAKYMIDILQSAKYEALQAKGREINQKREKVPLVTKPKGKQTNSQPKTAAEVWFPKSGAV